MNLDKIRIMKRVSMNVKNEFALLSENKYRDILFSNTLYSQIINSDAFQRLKDIRFLGAIDYTFKPNQYKKRHTRQEHSLGVAELALAYAENFELDQQTTDYIVVSALLHDIGHAPLSHSIENVFYERFNINHHIASIQIIKGEERIGHDLFKTLHKHNIELDRVISLIEGKEDSLAGKAFSSPISIDTIDGIIRSSSYFTTPKLSPMKVLESLTNPSDDSLKILDSFWELKHNVYKNFIHSKRNIVADTLSQNIAETMQLKKEHFFINESKYIKIFGSFYEQLKKEDKREEISYQKRDYKINTNIFYKTIDDSFNRYTCKKENSHIYIESFIKYYKTNKLKGL